MYDLKPHWTYHLNAIKKLVPTDYGVVFCAAFIKMTMNNDNIQYYVNEWWKMNICKETNAYLFNVGAKTSGKTDFIYTILK